MIMIEHSFTFQIFPKVYGLQAQLHIFKRNMHELVTCSYDVIWQLISNKYNEKYWGF